MAPPRSSLSPLSDWPLAARRGLLGVFTDIDDTLTTEGAITADALQALHDLRAAGLVVIPITGRPIGWCTPFQSGDAAQQWPVPAMVAENGAVAYVRQESPQSSSQTSLQPAWNGREQLSKLYQQDAATRAANATALQQVAQRVLREVPGATLSQDSAGRETDIAFDHSEFTHLPPDAIARGAGFAEVAHTILEAQRA